MPLPVERKRLGLPRLGGLALPALIGLLLIPALVLGMAINARRSFDHNREAGEAVVLSYEERLQMQIVFSLVQDGETGVRGFAISGDESFLEPYSRAVAQLPAERARLRQLQGHDVRPGEQQELDAINRLIDARFESLARTVSLCRQGCELARTKVATGDGKRIMDELRSRIARLEAIDADALAERVRADASRTRRTETSAFVSFLSLGALLFLAATLILRQSLAQRRLLDEAQANAARLSAIFDAAHDGLVTFNLSGTIQAMNRAGMHMFGYTAEELKRRDAGLLFEFPDADSFFLTRLMGEADSDGGLIREFTARRKDGSTFPAEVSIGRFSLPEGDHVVASFRDLTERRKADRLKAEFISTVSHELRTPLTSIAGSLGLLVGGAAGAMDERAARLIGIAHANSQRLVRLINDILDIEKIESGQMAFAMAPLALDKLVRSTVDSVQGLAQQLRVAFEVEAAPGASMVRGDADRLSQVVTNLLSNAAKVSPPGSTVRIQVASAPNHRVRLSVKDQGDGVPENFRDRIFSKFAQADSSDTRRMGGTGLGLAITREIVERHGGRIWFDSPPGESATFHVELPAYTPPRADGPGLGGRVLICEDDADAATVLAEMMATLGARSDTVGSIAEAEAALRNCRDYSVMLLDVNLPDGNGLDLLHRVRTDPETCKLPVLIVSGQAGPTPQALDVIDWIQKPVDPERLRSAVEAVKNGVPRPLVLHVEDDPDVRQLVGETLGGSFEIVAADSLAQARDLLERTTPKLAILDIALPDGSGLELVSDLRRQPRRVPVVVFSAQNPDDEDVPASVDAVLTKSRASLEYLADLVGRLAPRNPPRTEGE